MIELQIHRLAKYRKLDALSFDWDIRGKPRLRRYKPDLKPNAIALDNLCSGARVIVSDGPLYEVRMKINQ